MASEMGPNELREAYQRSPEAEMDRLRVRAEAAEKRILEMGAPSLAAENRKRNSDDLRFQLDQAEARAEAAEKELERCRERCADLENRWAYGYKVGEAAAREQAEAKLGELVEAVKEHEERSEQTQIGTGLDTHHRSNQVLYAALRKALSDG